MHRIFFLFVHPASNEKYACFTLKFLSSWLLKIQYEFILSLFLVSINYVADLLWTNEMFFTPLISAIKSGDSELKL